jgi:hypothetical protein
MFYKDPVFKKPLGPLRLDFPHSAYGTDNNNPMKVNNEHQIDPPSDQTSALTEEEAL